MGEWIFSGVIHYGHVNNNPLSQTFLILQGSSPSPQRGSNLPPKKDRGERQQLTGEGVNINDQGNPYQATGKPQRYMDINTPAANHYNENEGRAHRGFWATIFAFFTCKLCD
jgi:hypothetical protein